MTNPTGRTRRDGTAVHQATHVIDKDLPTRAKVSCGATRRRPGPLPHPGRLSVPIPAAEAPVATGDITEFAGS